MEEEKPRLIVPFDNPELVVLRNPVARAKFGLSLVQSKILFEIIAYLKTRPNDNFMTINVGDLLEKIGVETKRVKYYVEEIEEMTKKHLRIPEGDNEEGINYLAVNLLAGARFRIDKDGRGNIDIEISNMLKPYYLEIAKGDFFSYHILNTRVLKSTYSVKLYLLLKSYKRFGKLDIGLDELKGILELSATDYKQFPDFKKRVLERARTEIQEKNDIFFTYDEVRQFARNSKSPVVRIIFYIKDNPDQKLRMARFVEEKRTKKAASSFLAFEDAENTTNLGSKKAAKKRDITTDLGVGENASTRRTKTKLGVEKTPNLFGIQTNLGGIFDENLPKNNENRVGETDIQTNLGVENSGEPPTIKTDLGAESNQTPTNLGVDFVEKNLENKPSAKQKELLRLFRFFDKEATDAFILDYTSGLGQEADTILDALMYAQKQGTVKNVFAYLPTILRAKAGQGLAEKARNRAQKAAQVEISKQQLKVLKNQIEDLFEKIESLKRDVVRSIVGADEGATGRVIGQVKTKFAGTFGIWAEMPTDEFRENPLLRSLVLHEFRVQFPAEFDEMAGLTDMESQLAGLKSQAKLIDPLFSI
jgi:plasmid replication initiation protein